METTKENVNPAEFGLEEKKATELTVGLKTILAEREVLTNSYNDVIDLEITPKNIEIFKELRIKIRDNRTKGILVWHKTNKEVYLRAGQFVDAVKNREIAENERMEEKLSEAEKHFENLEKERLKAVHDERVLKLVPFGYEIGATDFSTMDENMFNAILVGAEKTHNDKIEALAKFEAERIEKERVEAEEKERQRVELERLRKEKEESDKILAEEKDKADAALKAEQEKSAKEKAEAERLAKIESDKQAKILAEQKASNDKLQAELKAKADAEAKVKADAEKAEALRIAEEKKAAKAPDKDKIKQVSMQINVLIDSLPICKTDEGKNVINNIKTLLQKTISFANEKKDSL